MNPKAFFDAALSTALDVGIASGDDVLRYVTPEILAACLPRPLWARLLTACVGASHVDAQLVLETVGVPNLCEHVPGPVLWACLAEIGARSLGAEAPHYTPPIVLAPAHVAPAPIAALLAPAPAAALVAPVHAPAPAPVALGPSIPAPSAVNPLLADLVAEMDADERPVPPPTRARTPTSQRFRPTPTGSNFGRPATNSGAGQPRRPQAAATSPASVVEAGTSRARRPQTEVSDYDIETDVRVGDDWRATIAPAVAAAEVDVDDEQLVDWSASEETVTGGDGLNTERKR